MGAAVQSLEVFTFEDIHQNGEHLRGDDLGAAIHGVGLPVYQEHLEQVGAVNGGNDAADEKNYNRQPYNKDRLLDYLPHETPPRGCG